MTMADTTYYLDEYTYYLDEYYRDFSDELEKMPQDAEACARDSEGDFVAIESVNFINQTGTPWVAIDGE